MGRIQVKDDVMQKKLSKKKIKKDKKVKESRDQMQKIIKLKKGYLGVSKKIRPFKVSPKEISKIKIVNPNVEESPIFLSIKKKKKIKLEEEKRVSSSEDEEEEEDIEEYIKEEAKNEVKEDFDYLKDLENFYH